MGSPLVGWARRLPQKALDTVTAPVTAFEGRFPELAGMLGLHPEQDPQMQQADPGMVQQANQSFVDAMNRQKAQPKPMRGANRSVSGQKQQRKQLYVPDRRQLPRNFDTLGQTLCAAIADSRRGEAHG